MVLLLLGTRRVGCYGMCTSRVLLLLGTATAAALCVLRCCCCYTPVGQFIEFTSASMRGNDA